jgi:endonuclease/exonuclease/phosphatase family metal-dependent hydrolase
MRKLLAFPMLGAALIGGLSFASDRVPPVNAKVVSSDDVGARGSISVLTYNIKGLPWPIATGRSEALEKIGDRLAQLRERGAAPKIVILQEGFTDAAAAIQHQGGYAYAADGPKAKYKSKVISSAPSKKFIDDASILKGEAAGKYVNSGLRIFSDYPIIKTERIAFPEHACAGFDCLANKGVLVAWIKVPSFSKPVAIIDAHLNSREASGVSDTRNNAAWAMQAKIVMRFIRDKIPAGAPVIFAGDLNTGQVPERIKVINDGGGFLPGASNALRLAIAADKVRDRRQRGEVRAIINHAKDRQWFRSGNTQRLSLIDVSVPFGLEPDGSSLSDHFGYIANYKLTPINPIARNGFAQAGRS